jgi:MerR family transcriptional regulator, light-induced transcriptional regulator
MLSTQEVAAMLDVTETTIKRWADDALLACVRTAGGHRKFLLSDIVNFADANGYAVGGATPPEASGEEAERLQVGVLTKNYPLVASVFQSEALRADRRRILQFLLYLQKQRVPFAVIVDDVVRPAFVAIGQLWGEGGISIAEEHAASQATMEAMILLSAELHHKRSNGLTALCACPGADLHELGIRAIAYALECEGWKVHFIGGNAPADTILERIGSVEADLLCLSMSGAKPEADLGEMVRRMVDRARASGGKVMAGGRHTEALVAEGVEFDCVAQSVGEALRYARDAFGLRPGPKKRTPALKPA